VKGGLKTRASIGGGKEFKHLDDEEKGRIDGSLTSGRGKFLMLKGIRDLNILGKVGIVIRKVIRRRRAEKERKEIDLVGWKRPNVGGKRSNGGRSEC